MKKILFIILAALTASTAFGLGIISFIKNSPTPDRIAERQIIQSTKIFDRTGQTLLYEIHGEEKRTVVPFGEIPTAVKQATLAAEDIHFYQHGGFDIKGIIRALLVNIFSGGVKQGGSTITQQLIKNSLLSREQTIPRKIKEILLAVLLESRYSKDQILGWYLNQIPYGSNAYGIEAAAETFFSKPSPSLTLEEAATLAALPKAPSYYSPYGPHKDELIKRKNTIIDRMRNLGFVSDQEAQRAKEKSLEFNSQKQNIKAPHFVMLVRDYLNERYGENVVERGGLKVTTTLSWDLQKKAEDAVREGAEKNEVLVGAYNAALTAIDPKTGEILAMVGSRDYWAKSLPQGCSAGVNCKFDPHVNIAIAERQPGSAFKPFVYASAFQKGFTPETVLLDAFIEFNPQCNPDGTPTVLITDPKGCYHPVNYDGKFHGPVSLRQALAQSLNVPSVQVLYLAGVQKSIELAKSMGITTLNKPDRYGLSLVLGGAEVKLLDMVSAFGSFSQDGVLNTKTVILKIEDAEGQILEEKKSVSQQVIDSEVARTINDVLSDNDARVPIFNPRSSLYFPQRQVAAKTGTTQDYRDAWVIGYTPSLVSGVWVGNNDNTSMNQNGLSIMVAGPIWHEFMDYALKDTPAELFAKPNLAQSPKPVLRGLWQGNEIIKIDSVSKKLATVFTPPELTEEIAVGVPHSILYSINKENPDGEYPRAPADDPQFKNWEASFQKWIKENGLSKNFPPKEKDDIHTPEAKPVIKITAPLGGTVLASVVIRGSVLTKFPLKEVSFFLNDAFIDSSLSYSFTFPLPEKTPNGEYTVKIKAYDIWGNHTDATFPITVQ